MRQEAFRGALLGLAIGDALGAAVEGRAPGSFASLTGMTGGGRFHLRPGQWTDDTSMALCVTESLLERRGFDLLDQMQRYLRWYREGHWSSRKKCFDVGGATREALELFERTGQPNCGSEDMLAAANGPLARVAPVAMFFARDAQAAADHAALSCRATHAAIESVDACRFFAKLLCAALSGASTLELLPPHFSMDNLTPAIAEIARGSYLHREPPAIIASGYVVKSLEAALWAFSRSSSYAEGALLAANLGHDAATTAAIYGQLAGAHYGEAGIPTEWLGVLYRRHQIAAMADQLMELATSR